MIAEFKRLRVWLIMSAAIAAFFPFYYLADNSDAIDFIAALCATVAIAVEYFYGPAFIKILRREAGEMTENHHFLLLGILFVAFSTALTRSYGIWWRMYGKALGYSVEGWVPAFAAYLAFIGYMNHIIAPRMSPEGVPIANKTRVIIVLCIGAIIGIVCAVFN